MAIVATDNRNYTNIANAIRNKNSSSTTYKPEDMASAIAAIPSGTVINNQDKIVTPNETTQLITKDSEIYTGLGTVTVNPIPSEYKDTSDATAVAKDVLVGKTAYNADGKIIGTLALQMGVVRPDAELVTTLSSDVSWVDDLELTIPAYTTTSTTLLAASEMTPTVTLTDLDNYNYYVLERALTIPTYDSTVGDTKGKGRQEYQFCSAAYEVVSFPPNTFLTLDGNKSYDKRSTSVYSAGNCARLVYWSTASAITAYASAAYGCTTTITAPAISSGSALSPVLTIKFPAIVIRGHATYFSSTYMDGTADARTQFVAEVYKVPKSSDYGINGWGLRSQAEHVLDCIDTTNHDLT